jgi:hypothetical protein
LFFEFFEFLSFLLGFLRLQLKIPSEVIQFIEKLPATGARQPEGSFRIQAQLSRICHAQVSITIRPDARASASSLGGRPLPAFISLSLLAGSR